MIRERALDQSVVAVAQARSHSLDAALRGVATGALALSALVHYSVIWEHFAAWGMAGAFLVTLTAAEAAMAFGLAMFFSRKLLVAGIALALATVFVWFITRTVGIPWGPQPWTPVAAGVKDVFTSSLNMSVVFALLPLLGAHERRAVTSA